jgi:glycogen debranching enzyme
MCSLRTLCHVAVLVVAAVPVLAQAPSFQPISEFPLDTSGPVIRAHTEALKPFTVAGERGVLLGEQDGTFEAWVLPVKILSHLTIEADIEGYTVPIDVNQQSAEIEVRPDRTTITYAHIGFTVRQIMFSPNDAPAGTGPVVLFQFDCLHPTDFTLRFTPDLEYMWPERNEGHPSPEWVAPGPNAYERAGGYYVLHADYPDLAAAITIPGALPGIMAPYQERPQVHPVELKIHIDPARDRGKLFPLLMAVGTNTQAANTHALGETLEKLNQSIAFLYAAHEESYKKLLANSVSIETPDKSLDQAFQWAEISIEQLKAKPFVPDPGKDPQAAAETALVAGYYASGDSARPGFGWFFGRDALYTLYAVNGYGDFGLARSELEFLIHRQRADGKIMHEYSQTAPAIDWLQFPYMYAAADSTPLFLLATLDYARASGDVAFLSAHREAIEKAWAFETGHADTNGIYDNRQGTGWVESWPGGMPHQEIYLALLDQQASAAMAQIADLLHDQKLSLDAKSRADAIAKTINEQFYDADKGCYAFSRNANGTLDRTTTVYPALAWWSELPGTAAANGAGSVLAHPEGCLKQLADASLETDWGLRDVSNEEKIYDGMSYHQGSVWPLFTGWAALAEYRGGQPLAGYQMLKENANLTWAQDLGADTELLSGDFFVPFGRSTSHQLWSSAMLITPTLRGLFGIDADAETKTITVNPRLPAGWDRAEVKHLLVGNDTVDLLFTLNIGQLTVQIKGENAAHIKLATSEPGAQQHSDDRIEFPPPPVAIAPPQSAPLPGSRTASVRVLSETLAENRMVFTLEGPAGSSFRIPLFTFSHLRKLNVTGAKLQSDPSSVLTGQFPAGEGWKTITVTLTR